MCLLKSFDIVLGQLARLACGPMRFWVKKWHTLSAGSHAERTAGFGQGHCAPCLQTLPTWLWLLLLLFLPRILLAWICVTKYTHFQLTTILKLGKIHSALRHVPSFHLKIWFKSSLVNFSQNSWPPLWPIGKNLSRYVRYRDFYHLMRQTAIFRIFAKNRVFKNNFCDKPRYFELYNSLSYLEFSCCVSKEFKYNKFTNCDKVDQSL